METMQQEQCIRMLKALADDTRIRIYEMLRCGSLCACAILEQLQISQPTLSHHMKVLCDSGLVVARKEWRWTHYALNCESVHMLVDFLGDTACRKSCE